MSAHVALLTPMTETGELDFSALERHLARVIEAGADGVVALGTMGEFPDLDTDEREAIITAIVRQIDGSVPVTIGVGGLATWQACEHAKRAEKAGADRVLALPPLYWKLSDDALIAHFRAISAVTTLPLMLYDIPFLAGTALSLNVIRTLAESLPGVIGVKLSGADLSKVNAALAIKKTRADFEVTIGHRELALPGLLMGADALIGELINVIPETHATFVKAIRAGDYATAIKLNREILAFSPLSELSIPPMLALKAAARVAGSSIQPIVRTWPTNPESVIDEATRMARTLLQRCA